MAIQPSLLFLPFLVILMEMTAALKTAVTSSATARASLMARMTERTILCSDGMKLAAQEWTNNNSNNSPNDSTTKILCLHGWLDNCRSFDYLAPYLVQSLHNSKVVTLDFPGHGWSSHKSADGGAPTVLSEAAFYVAETVSSLQWNSFVLVGHSMGAAVSLIYAAAFPEHVSSLVLLEGAGPLTRKGKDVAKHVRAAIQKRQAGNAVLYPEYSTAQKKKQPRIYPSLDQAVETRCKTATLSPGNQYLSKEAAQSMVERATVSVNGGGIQFRHDVRLQWPSLQYMTDEQVDGLFNDVECRVCLLLAEDGWPFDESRKRAVLEKLQPSVLKTLPGSHHFHADPESSQQVAMEVVAFLQQQQVTQNE